MKKLALLMLEIKAIMGNSAVVLTMFAGVIFYSFLYPLPYANQTPKQQKTIIHSSPSHIMSHLLVVASSFFRFDSGRLDHPLLFFRIQHQNLCRW